MARDPDPNEGTVQSPHPRSDDNRLEAFKHRLDGQGGVHTAVRQHRGHTGQRAGHRLVPSTQCCISPEVQNGVGDGWGPVVKGLNDNGEAWWRGRLRVSLWSLPHLTCCATPETPHPGAEPPQPAHFCKRSGAEADRAVASYMVPQVGQAQHTPGSSVLQPLTPVPQRATRYMSRNPKFAHSSHGPRRVPWTLPAPFLPAAVPTSTWLSPCPRGQCHGALQYRYTSQDHLELSFFAPYSPPGCDSWKGKTRLFQQCWAWPHLLTEQMNTFMDSVSLGKK